MNHLYHPLLWCEVRSKCFPDLGGWEASSALAHLLGIYYPESGWHDHMEYTPELLRTLKLLEGPNWKFYLSVLKARSGEVS